MWCYCFDVYRWLKQISCQHWLLEGWKEKSQHEEMDNWTFIMEIFSWKQEGSKLEQNYSNQLCNSAIVNQEEGSVIVNQYSASGRQIGNKVKLIVHSYYILLQVPTMSSYGNNITTAVPLIPCSPVHQITKRSIGIHSDLTMHCN